MVAVVVLVSVVFGLFVGDSDYGGTVVVGHVFVLVVVDAVVVVVSLIVCF